MTTSIFRLDEIRCNETESQSYLEAITSVRGHFSSLEKKSAPLPIFCQIIVAFIIHHIIVSLAQPLKQCDVAVDESQILQIE